MCYKFLKMYRTNEFSEAKVLILFLILDGVSLCSHCPREKIYEQWHRQYSRAESQNATIKNYSSGEIIDAFQISEMNK